MRRCVAAFFVAGWLVFGAGCVERRMVVTSDPPGALILHNGQPIGNAPADDHFVYYGNHHFTIIRPGYATLQVDQRIRAPWYQFFPLDLVSEILLPFQIEDVRRFTYQLQPLPGTRPEEVSDRAAVLRQRGNEIADPSTGPPRGVPAPAPGAAAVVPPAGAPVVPPAGAPVPPARAPVVPPAQPGVPPPVPPASPPPFIGSAPLGAPGLSDPS